jgi:hypothetical protein
MKATDYIPVENFSGSSIERLGTLQRHVPIERISVDKQRLGNVNDIYPETVNSIVSDFQIDSWDPISVDDEYFIRDGQHRLAAAKKMGLKFIDVLVLDYEYLAIGKYRREHYKKLSVLHPRVLTPSEIEEKRMELTRKRLQKSLGKKSIIL